MQPFASFPKVNPMPKIDLTYFNAPGRAEPVRVALFLSGLPFTDHRVDFAGFGAMKAAGALPLGSVPVMDVDGLRLTQTGAMLRYVARLGNTDLYPNDAFDAFVVDSCIDTFNDTVSNALTPSMFERDMEKKLEMRATFVAGPLTLACRYVEGLIERSGGPFLLGQTLTIADLLIASQVLTIQSGHLDGITGETLAPYPLLRGLAEAYLAHPRIQAYRSK